MRTLLAALAILVLTNCSNGTEVVATTATAGLLTNEQVQLSTLPNSIPSRTVSLTYDDGPDENWSNGDNSTRRIAEYLNNEGIRATFFFNGVRLTQPSQLATMQYVTFLGHRVANHTQNHLSLPSLSASDQRAEFAATQSIIDPFIVDGFYLFRPPSNDWGQGRPTAGACEGSASVASNIRSDSFLSKLTGPFCFDWDAHDWSCTENHDGGGPYSPTVCRDVYLANKGPNENGIIQMHDRNPNAAGTSYTFDLTVGLVSSLRAASGTPYTFIPLDGLPGVRGQLSFPEPTLWTTEFSDGTWNTNIGYYGTIRTADLNGDGLWDVCGRDVGGIRCATAAAPGVFNPSSIWLSTVSDSQGYLPPEYSTTFQLGKINNDNKADACIRSVVGYVCYESNGSSFTTSGRLASFFSDANGWNQDQSFYRSIRVGDINSDGFGDVCGRGGAGVFCSTYNAGSGTFNGATLWSSAFSDAAGWRHVENAGAIQIADLNNDQKADICGRSPRGMVCALSNGSNAFVDAAEWSWPSFSDAEGWNRSPSLFASIRLGDFNRDGQADVCGRNATGIMCASSSGTKFLNSFYVLNTNFNDTWGWGAPEYGSTLIMGDVNGDKFVDVCARAGSGIACMIAPARLATYDATAQMPKCSTVGSTCDTGVLLEGRGTMALGAEPNTSNNGGTCLDGSAGTYRIDESVERIRVRAVGSSVLASSSVARVEVSVRSSAANSVVHFYTASDATNPTWVFRGTTQLTGIGPRSIVWDYTLPSGTLQVVRAVMARSGTSASPCPSNNVFRDVDQVAFATN